jgi:predicted RNase H-like nuclease (RuvC/YqgF family)
MSTLTTEEIAEAARLMAAASMALERQRIKINELEAEITNLSIRLEELRYENHALRTKLTY